MSTQYDYIVFIGRFQPFHNDHYRVIEEALKISKEVIVLVGSADGPRTIKNPFTYAERRQMIHGSFPQVTVGYLNDYPLDDSLWIKQVKDRVSGILSSSYPSNVALKGGIIGCSKDDSSWYLGAFPWNRVVPQQGTINARDIRKIMFEPNQLTGYADWEEYVPDGSEKVLFGLTGEDWWKSLREENRFYIRHDEMWANSPYPPTFVTVDTVFKCGEYIALIKRKNHPGKDLWALPGGYLDKNETLDNAARRELKEETGHEYLFPLGAPTVIHYPGRSLRGTIVTNVFLYEYNCGNDWYLPKLQAGDDAAATKWVYLKDLRPGNMFEDHYHIIRKVLNLE